MGGVEQLVGLDKPELIPAIPKILMLLYQADVLEEEFIKSWGTHVSKKYVDRDTSKKVRKASEPFLKVRIYFVYSFIFVLTDRVLYSTDSPPA